MRAIDHAARAWVEDLEGEETDVLTDTQIHAYVRRNHANNWPGFLTVHAPDDALDVARAWIEHNPMLGVDPDADPLTIWTAVCVSFTGGWDMFADWYAYTCVCGCPKDSMEHAADGHPFQSRQEVPA